MPDLVTVGEPLLELAATEPGELGEVDGYVRGWGGDTANTALAAVRLGATVGYVTRVGDDEFGHALLRMWRSEGIDTSQVAVDEDRFTGLYFVGYGPQGHRFAYHRRGSAASALDASSVDPAYIAAARVLHVSGISQALSSSAADAVEVAIDVARRNGVLVSYDANIRPGLAPPERLLETFEQSVARADIVFASEDDLRHLYGDVSAASLAARLGPDRPVVTVVKQEARGATFVLADGTITHMPGYDVTAVDTAGAGDAFDAGFLVEWLRHENPVEAVRFANAVGALTVQGVGAVGSLPDRAAVAAFTSVAADHR